MPSLNLQITVIYVRKVWSFQILQYNETEQFKFISGPSKMQIGSFCVMHIIPQLSFSSMTVTEFSEFI